MNSFEQWRDRIQGLYRTADAIVASTRFDPNARSQFVGRVRTLLSDLETPGAIPRARDDRRESLVGAIQLLRDATDGVRGSRLADQSTNSVARTRDALVDQLQVTMARIYQLDLVCDRCSQPLVGQPNTPLSDLLCDTCRPLIAAESRADTARPASSTSRERDESGVLFHKKHLDDDLASCLATASRDFPVVVAFLDMNGLKSINDTFGHDAGDEAIIVFMQAVFASFREPGEQVYRRSDGGDEVVVVFSAPDPDHAISRVTRCLERVRRSAWRCGEEWRSELTAACGIVCAPAPANARELLRLADAEMYRAKRFAQGTPRPSSIAVQGSEPLLVK